MCNRGAELADGKLLLFLNDDIELCENDWLDKMGVTVPEGSYQVDISYNGGGGTKNVVINRNEETTLDIPLSSSRVGRKRSFRLNPFDRRID